MKRRTSGSDLSHLLQEQMNVYDGVEQVPNSGVENIICRLYLAVTTDGCNQTTDTVVKSTKNQNESTIVDSNRCLSNIATSVSSTTTTTTTNKHQNTIPVVNIDTENYMLRGVNTGVNVNDSPRSRSLSFTNGTNKQHQNAYNAIAATGIYKKETSADDDRENYYYDSATATAATTTTTTTTTTDMNMDMFCLRETTSSVPNTVVDVTHPPPSIFGIASSIPQLKDGIIVTGDCVSIPATVSTNCARTMSFHALFCTCKISCCCMCGSLCSPDCHACFHSLCVRFAANYVCQRNTDVLQPVTLNHDKVSPTDVVTF